MTATEYKIITDMPMPVRPRGTGNPRGSKRPRVYPFGELGVGHAFIIPADDSSFYYRQGNLQWHRVQAAASQYSKRNNVKLEIRRLDDGSVGVWRTA